MKLRLGPRAEWIWAPVLYLAAVLVLYRPVWWGIDGHRLYYGWDAIESFWPDLAYYARAIRHGDWPFWNPYDRGGYAFFADPHVGIYYPVSWFLALIGAVAGTTPAWVHQVKAIGHMFILGVCMHAYLRSRKLGPAAASLGGIAAVASGPFLWHKASAILWPVDWAPLLWIATDRFLERTNEPASWRRASFLGGALGLSCLSGHPQGLHHALLTTAALGGFRFVVVLLDARKAGTWKPLLRRVGVGLAIAVAVAAALMLVSLIPTWTAAGYSVKANRTMSYILSNPLAVVPALHGLIAPAAGNVETYFGLLVVSLSLSALAFAPRADRGVPIVAFLAGAFLMLLTFGGATPILPFLGKHVPSFGLFRECNRYKVPADLLFVVCAAHGLDALLKAEAGVRWKALAAAVAPMLMIAILAIAFRGGHMIKDLGRYAPTWSMTVIVIVLGAGLLAALVLAPPRFRMWAAAALVLLAFVDVWRQGRYFDESVYEKPPDNEEDRRYLAGLGDVEVAYRLYDEFVMEQRPGSRLGVRDFRGYPSGDPFDQVRYHDILERARRRPQILEAYNVRWVLHGAHHRNQKMVNYLGQPPTVTAPNHFRALDAKRFEALHPVPLVAWYGGVKLMGTTPTALDAIEASEDAEGVRRFAVVERGDAVPELAGLPEDGPPSVAGTVTSYRANSIAFDIDAPAAGLVVLNEAFYGGWKVTVDDKAATPVRANVLLRGVVVGAGHHRVVWTFAPRGYWWLFFLWLAAIGVLVAGARSARAESRRRSKPAPAAPPGSASGESGSASASASE